MTKFALEYIMNVKGLLNNLRNHYITVFFVQGKEKTECLPPIIVIY